MFVPALAIDLHLAKSNGLFSVLVLLHLLAPFDMVDRCFLLSTPFSPLFQGHLTHWVFLLPHWWLVLFHLLVPSLLPISIPGFCSWSSSLYFSMIELLSSFNGFKDYLKSCDFQIYMYSRLVPLLTGLHIQQSPQCHYLIVRY